MKHIKIVSKILNAIFRLVISVPQMPQFPPGFQGAALSQFAGNAANFTNFRPQFSVPGQSPASASNFSTPQVNKRKGTKMSFVLNP